MERIIERSSVQGGDPGICPTIENHLDWDFKCYGDLFTDKIEDAVDFDEPKQQFDESFDFSDYTRELGSGYLAEDGYLRYLCDDPYEGFEDEILAPTTPQVYVSSDAPDVTQGFQLNSPSLESTNQEAFLPVTYDSLTGLFAESIKEEDSPVTPNLSDSSLVEFSGYEDCPPNVPDSLDSQTAESPDQAFEEDDHTFNRHHVNVCKRKRIKAESSDEEFKYDDDDDSDSDYEEYRYKKKKKKGNKHLPYDKKKLQNRVAAKKYRERIKKEQVGDEAMLEQLELRNQQLVREKEEKEAELKMLHDLFDKMTRNRQ